MKCDYEGCLDQASCLLGKAQLCTEHYNNLKDIKVTDRQLGHESIYKPEPETSFDALSELNLHRKRKKYGKN